MTCDHSLHCSISTLLSSFTSCHESESSDQTCCAETLWNLVAPLLPRDRGSSVIAHAFSWQQCLRWAEQPWQLLLVNCARSRHTLPLLLLPWQVMPWRTGCTSCWDSLCVLFVWASKSVFISAILLLYFVGVFFPYASISFHYEAYEFAFIRIEFWFCIINLWYNTGIVLVLNES